MIDTTKGATPYPESSNPGIPGNTIRSQLARTPDQERIKPIEIRYEYHPFDFVSVL
jgi:hypothetical protein